MSHISTTLTLSRPYLRTHRTSSHVLVLGWRLLIALVIYTLCRIVFGIYNNDLLSFDGLSNLGRIFAGGFRFDAAGIVYVNLLVILLSLLPIRQRNQAGYQRAISWTYWLCNIPALIVNMADTVYFRFTLRRTTIGVTEEFANENLLGFLYFVIDYWPITLSTFALAALWISLYPMVRLDKQIPQPQGPLAYYSRHTLILLMGVILALYAARGFELNERAMNLNRAGSYISYPQQAAMVHNTPYALIRTIGKQGLAERIYFPREEAQKIFSALGQAREAAPYFGQFKGKNVVIIIWEGLSREWVGSLNPDIPNYKGYTPFLDSLISQSYCALESFSCGSKSIDAPPAIIASIPKPGIPFVTSPYASNGFGSIIQELNKEGYQSAFFHNGTNGSMSFDATARSLGYQAYFGRSEYNNDADWDGTWGIWDEEFLQFMLTEMKSFKEPFVVTEFTTSSHSPWRTPEKYDGILPKGNIPQHRSMAYTDLSLRRFFERAKNEGWYDNTLFVVVADHSISGEREEYKNSAGLFRIPIIFHDPSGTLPRGIDPHTIVQQADIYPTLMALMGLKQPFVSFGHNIFDPEAQHFAVSNINGTYQMIIEDYILLYDGEEVKGFYNRKEDPRLQHDLKESKPEALDRLLPLMQAYVQEYHDRMIHNKLLLH